MFQQYVEFFFDVFLGFIIEQNLERLAAYIWLVPAQDTLTFLDFLLDLAVPAGQRSASWGPILEAAFLCPGDKFL